MTLMKNKNNNQTLLEELEDYSRSIEKIIQNDAQHINRTIMHLAYLNGRIENLKKAKAKH